MLSDIGGGLGGAIGGIAVLAGAGGKGGDKFYKKAVEILEKIKEPTFDMRELTAPELQIFAEYFPEIYNAVVPDDVKQVVDSPVARDAQVRNLGRLETIAEEGLPLSERLATQQAGDALQGEIAAADRGVRSDLARRGRLGGGEEVVARQQANQNAIELANQLGTGLAQEAIGNRRDAISEAAGLGGQLRSGDIDLSRMNADIANRFNEMRTGRQDEAARYAAGARERAGFGNVENRQRVGEANTLAAYENAAGNLDRRNRLLQQAFSNTVNRSSLLADAYMRRGLQKDQDKAARERSIVGIGQGLGQAGGGIAGLF